MTESNPNYVAPRVACVPRYQRKFVEVMATFEQTQTQGLAGICSSVSKVKYVKKEGPKMQNNPAYSTHLTNNDHEKQKS